MSIGFPGTGAPDGSGVACSEIAGLNAALDFAHTSGVVLVAAAGNDGGIVSCPAAHPHVISVGATRFDAQVTFYSNNGSALDISAPGGDPLRRPERRRLHATVYCRRRSATTPRFC